MSRSFKINCNLIALLVGFFVFGSASYAQLQSCKEIYTEGTAIKPKLSPVELRDQSIALADSIMALADYQGPVGLQVAVQQLLETRYALVFEHASDVLASFAGLKEADELRKQAQILRASSATILNKSIVVSRLLEPKTWSRLLNTANGRELKMQKAVQEIRECRAAMVNCIANNDHKIEVLQGQARLVHRTVVELTDTFSILNTALEMVKTEKANTSELNGITFSAEFYKSRFTGIIALLQASLEALDKGFTEFQAAQSGNSEMDHNLLLLVVRGAPDSIRKLPEQSQKSESLMSGRSEKNGDESANVRTMVKVLFGDQVEPSQWGMQMETFLRKSERLSKDELMFIMENFPTKLRWGTDHSTHVLVDVHNDMALRGMTSWGYQEKWAPYTLSFLRRLLLNNRKTWRKFNDVEKQEAATWINKKVDDFLAEAFPTGDFASNYKLNLHTYFTQLFVEVSR